MFKKLSKSVREYRRPALLTPLMVILEVGVEIIIPLLMAGLIDKGIDKGNMSVVTKYGIVLLIVALVGLLLGYLAGCFSAKASCGFARNLRKDMFYNIQTFSFSNIDSFSISSLITRLTTDVTNVQMAFQMIIRMAIRAPIMLIFSLTVCFNISAKLSLIYLACMPVMIIGLLIIMRHAHPIFNRVFKKYDRLNNVVQENVKGIRVVKSFNQEEYEKTKFKTISNDVCTDFSKAEKTLAWNMPLVQFCMYACMLLISWFGARLIVSSGQTALTTGELLSLFTYTIQILSSLMMLSMVLVMITMSKASAKRIVEVLNTKSDITNPASPVTSVKDGSVEFDNVDFVYARNADNFITMLPEGYNTVIDGEGSGLSQGQRQLVSIARAEVVDPPVMILDEATSSIDTRTEALVQRGMDTLMKGRTVFVIAHRLSTIQNADNIIVLDHGEIIEQGNHDQLIRQKGTYYSLYTGAFELE